MLHTREAARIFLDNASAINDSGQVAGWAMTADGFHGNLLTVIVKKTK